MLALGLVVTCFWILSDDSRTPRREAHSEAALATIERALVGAPDALESARAVVERAFESAVTHDGDSIAAADVAAPASPPERRARIVGRLRRQRGDERPVREFEALIFELERAPGGEWRAAQRLGGMGLVRESSGSFGDSDFAPAQLALLDGRFALTLAATCASERRELRLRVSFVESKRENAWIELPTDFNGTLDVGDVLLLPPAELASGVVVDERGQPIDDAHIDVRLEGVDLSSEDWRFGLPRSTSSKRDGSFLVRGDTSAASLQLEVSHASFRTQRVAAVHPRTSGLRIVLADGPRGTLDARLVLVDARAASDVKALLLERSTGRSREARARDGRLAFRGLDAGVYDLRLVLEPFDELVRSIDRLDVVDGRACADARLDPIDLKGAITTSEASLRRKDGQPFALELVTLVRSDGQRVPRRSEIDGRLRIPSVSPAPKFDVVTSGGKQLAFRSGAEFVVDD